MSALAEDAVRTLAGFRGHEEFNQDDACPLCKMTVAEMMRVGTIPSCREVRERQEAVDRAMRRR